VYVKALTAETYTIPQPTYAKAELAAQYAPQRSATPAPIFHPVHRPVATLAPSTKKESVPSTKKESVPSTENEMVPSTDRDCDEVLRSLWHHHHHSILLAVWRSKLT
jgi:hypothetical protein